MNKVIPVLGNSQKLDGGAMFGNVPKAMWQQWVDVDSENLINLACRAMLIQEQNTDGKVIRNILLETGIGAFFEPKLKQRFGIVESKHILLESLAKIGLSDADIDIVVLSHLHFDHAGGLLTAWQPDEDPKLLFPKAKFLVSKTAYERAINPHPRDKASFIPIINKLLEQSSRLELIDSDTSDILGKNYSFIFSDGHTPGMMLTEIKQSNFGRVIFTADLIPASQWVHIPITMGYDRFPEQVINEKQKLLEYALQNNIQLFYTHDPKVFTSKVTKNEKQKFMAIEINSYL